MSSIIDGNDDKLELIERMIQIVMILLNKIDRRINKSNDDRINDDDKDGDGKEEKMESSHRIQHWISLKFRTNFRWFDNVLIDGDGDDGDKDYCVENIERNFDHKDICRSDDEASNKLGDGVVK